ncbi:MAG: hypothetical protein JXB39_16870 [Deltaproteobacteria bacterium]|nr:hypothetical protein [Deltaproteobacteria bacterium]
MDLPSIEAALGDLHDCLGEVDDAELARLAGVDEEDVRALREARAIRPWSARGRRATRTGSATPAQLEAWRRARSEGASCFRVVFEDAVIFVAARTVAEAVCAASAACRSAPIGVEPVGPLV